MPLMSNVRPMRLFSSLLCLLLLTGCQSSVPEQAVLAIALHVPAHPRLASCIDISGANPSNDLISQLRAKGREVFLSSDCSQNGWSVVTKSGKRAYFESFGPFTRTSPWGASLRVHSYSNGMHSDVWLFKLRLSNGLWVVESEHQVSMA